MHRSRQAMPDPFPMRATLRSRGNTVCCSGQTEEEHFQRELDSYIRRHRPGYARTAPANGYNTAGNAIKETFRIHTMERPTCHTVQGGSQRSRSTYENVPPKEHKLSSLMLQNHSVLMDVLCFSACDLHKLIRQ